MQKKDESPFKFLRTILIAACSVSGWLAGANIDRYIVQLPAWKYVDIVSWAEYSRHADLGNGLWLYPLEAVGTFILLVIASIIAIVNRPILKQSAPIIYAAAFFAALKIALSIFSSPVIMSLRTSGNDKQMLQNAFDMYHFWSPYNVIVQLFLFFFCLWALGKILVFSKTTL